MMQSPYKGLAPYDIGDKHNFFGRDQEKQILIGKIFSYRVVLFFAGTGVGKSSLLRAGVMPVLMDKENLDVVYYADWVQAPLIGLQNAIKTTLVESDKISGRELNGSKKLHPSLEVCTAYSSEPLVIILDQFEELFQYHAGSGELQPFIDQLGQVINDQNLPVNIVFAMREDFLAELNIFKGKSPGLFDNYYRLEQLRTEQARTAIEKPLAGTDFSYEKGLVDVLLGDLGKRGRRIQTVLPGVLGATEQNGFIEPPYLQIVCNELWWAEQGNPQRQISKVKYEELGSTENIVRGRAIAYSAM